MKIFGASSGRRWGSTRRRCVDEAVVKPAVLADGAGENGSVEPSVAMSTAVSFACF
jgi:hypothetical protein